MKKLLALGLSLAMLCSFAACSGDESTQDSVSDNVAEETVVEPTQSQESVPEEQEDEVDAQAQAEGTQATAQTFDTATYYTYDTYGQKIDDVLQFTIDGDYMQVTLLDRYQTDPILIDDEEDSNSFNGDGTIWLYNNLVIDMQTGEEVYFNLDLSNQFGYAIGSDLESDEVFFAQYTIRVIEDDSWKTLETGMVYADLSQSAGLASRASDYTQTYAGLDGAPSLIVSADGFEIEGVVSCIIPIYEYILTVQNNCYFSAIDNEGNEVYILLDLNNIYYTLYDSDFNKISTWQGSWPE